MFAASCGNSALGRPKRPPRVTPAWSSSRRFARSLYRGRGECRGLSATRRGLLTTPSFPSSREPTPPRHDMGASRTPSRRAGTALTRASATQHIFRRAPIWKYCPRKSPSSCTSSFARGAALLSAFGPCSWTGPRHTCPRSSPCVPRARGHGAWRATSPTPEPSCYAACAPVGSPARTGRSSPRTEAFPASHHPYGFPRPSRWRRVSLALAAGGTRGPLRLPPLGQPSRPVYHNRGIRLGPHRHHDYAACAAPRSGLAAPAHPAQAGQLLRRPLRRGPQADPTGLVPWDHADRRRAYPPAARHLLATRLYRLVGSATSGAWTRHMGSADLPRSDPLGALFPARWGPRGGRAAPPRAGLGAPRVRVAHGSRGLTTPQHDGLVFPAGYADW